MTEAVPEPIAAPGVEPRFGKGTVFWALACGVHGSFVLLLLPRTLVRVIAALRPGGAGVRDSDLWVFGCLDARFRPYYNKIARDFATQGRFGYAWEDGLGVDLGSRIYSNWATYYLLHLLGTRWMCLLGYALLIAVSATVVGISLGVWAALVTAVLLAGSPLCVCCFTHWGKPELIWWFMAVILLWTLGGEPSWVTGLLWSGVAFVNLAVSVMLLGVIGPVVAVSEFSVPHWLGFALGCFPGLAKHAWHSWYMHREGQLKSIVEEQSSLWKHGLFFKFEHVLVLIPFVVSIVLSTLASEAWLPGGVLLLTCVGLFWANWRMIYMNDMQSFLVMLLAIGVGWAAVCQSSLGLAALFFLAYTHPVSCGQPLQGAPVKAQPGKSRRERRLAKWAATGKLTWKHFPYLRPQPLVKPEALWDFFAQVPDGARIICETKVYIRRYPELRWLLQWTDQFLPQRQVDIITEEYSRIAEPEADEAMISNFNAERGAEQLTENAAVLGVDHALACTGEMAETLLAGDWREVAQADTSTLTDDQRAMFSDEVPDRLWLFRHPIADGPISPPVAWQRQGNRMQWLAKAGETYRVRYRFYKAFAATVADEAVAVQPWKPRNGLPLTFMELTTPVDGELVLTYRTHHRTGAS